MSIQTPTVVQATSNTVTVVLSPQLNQISVVQPQNGATVVRDTVIKGPQGPTGPQGVPGLNDWVVLTGNYNAQNRDRLIADTSNGSFTITLPYPPNLGDYMQITDGNDWSTHNLHIDPQSATIEGFSGVMDVNVQGITIELIHDNTTWQVTATLGRNGETGPSGPSGPSGPAASMILTTTTTVAISNIANAINTAGKVAGLMVYNTTNNLIYVADGSTAGSAWHPSNGAAAITPA